MDNTRYDYSAIVDRPPLRWPNGARVALWVIPNIEHFLFDRPSTSITAVTTQFVPDVLNYSWRDYGVRVGIWRLMEVMERHGIKGTVALNSDVCRHYPRIVEAGKSLGWEWMGHGRNNSTLLAGLGEAAERALVREVRDTIAAATGARPRGWLGPALTETYLTPDILAEEGFDYVGDWVNDEQPYPLKVRRGRLISIPYSIEINDIPCFLDAHRSAEEFERMIVDQFDGLYEDGAKTGRVMAICLHPFLIGHPFRAKYLDRALAHIRRHQEVWFATGAEIVDAYLAAQGA
jgi:peptidoglycan/xylan/chitin deacetylase (PgdA/CDA1 family)